MQLRPRGFTLVELLVAMVAGLILVAAVSALFATVLKSNRTAMQVSRLNQELQSITDMIARDAQRAGYDGKASMLLEASASKFTFSTNTDLMNETASGSQTYRCIRIRYDYDSDGCLDKDASSCGTNSGDVEETRVYSFSSTDKGIKLAEGNSVSCSDGSLLSTDNTIEISSLTFSLLGSSVSSGARTVRLTISGQYKANTVLKLTLQRDIKLRNDGY